MKPESGDERRGGAVVLLSGGLDSTVAAAAEQRAAGAAPGGGVRLGLTFDYGQRAAASEVRAARAIAQALGFRQRVIRLDFLREITTTALVDRARELPDLPLDRLDDAAGAALCAMKDVWVPNRNGILVAVAAAYAESLGVHRVVVGFNREEGATFPDNSAEFVARQTAALAFSTLSKVEMCSPTMDLDKAGIVRLGYEIGAPLEHLWSCYEGGERHCGRCESCKRLFRALDAAAARERFLAEWRGRPREP